MNTPGMRASADVRARGAESAATATAMPSGVAPTKIEQTTRSDSHTR